MLDCKLGDGEQTCNSEPAFTLGEVNIYNTCVCIVQQFGSILELVLVERHYNTIFSLTSEARTLF